MTSGAIDLVAGAGDDRITLGALAMTTGHLEGGAGEDVLVVNAMSQVDPSRISGFEFVEINGVRSPWAELLL